MPPVRAFIAIELPPAMQNRLAAVVTPLREPLSGAVRWLPVNDIHLTMKFLGDVEEVLLGRLIARMRALAAQVEPFTISVAQWGAFPNPRRPRVVWVGVDPSPRLIELAAKIELETRALGFEPDARPFSPHLTIGRVTQNASLPQLHRLTDLLMSAPLGEIGSVAVSQLVLFQSRLSRTGAQYSALLKAPLARPSV